MQTVAAIVKVDQALDAYRDALTELLVTLDQDLRHHNTEADATRRDIWRSMRDEVVILRDAAYDSGATDVHIVSVAHAAASIAR